MTVAIEKEMLLAALDNGQVRFNAEGDLTPPDVYKLLQRNADRLADSSGKSDLDIDSLFDPAPTVKVTTHHGERPNPQLCRIRGG